MAADLQPPPSPVANPPPPPTLPSAPAPALAPTSDNPALVLAPKRHRRPSVRLGDIGDQPATLRTSKPWRLSPNPNTSKSSKTRPLTNLVTPSNGNPNPNPNPIFSAETPSSINGSSHRKFPKDFKSRQRTTSAAKRLRSSNFRIDDPDNKYNDADFDDHEEGFKDFDPDGSDPDPDQDQDQDLEPQSQSPLHSADDMALLDAWHGHNRRSIRGFGAAATRVSDSRPDMGLDGFPESDSPNRGGSGFGLEDGVRSWLSGLGLGRYAPVFEIHEVDDEILPYLTLEDLKDMGITAVGSRRKLYFAIQKLRKGLSFIS